MINMQLCYTKIARAWLLVGPFALGAAFACSEDPASSPDPTEETPDATAPSVDAGAKAAAALEVEVIEVRLAPRARATISFDDWAGGGLLPRVVDAGALGFVSGVEGANVTVDALRSARGSTSIEVASDTGGQRARIDVTVDVRPWAYVCDVAYEAESSLVDPGDERVMEAWSSGGGRRFGTASSAATTTAFAWTPGQAPAELPVPVGATGATARHRSGPIVWGSVISAGGPAPAYFDVATSAATVLPWTTTAEIFFESAGALVGARWEGGAPRAIRCATRDEASCEGAGPEDADESTARFIDGVGAVIGCGTVGGHRRAFVRSPAGLASWLPEPSRGCLSGHDAAGARLGEIDRSPGETWGYVASSPSCEVRVDRAWGTRLFGSGELGVLLGSARDVSGAWRATALTPLPSTSRVRFSAAPEPTDPGLAHACGHTKDSPVPITSTDALATTGAIVRTHTNYHVTRDASGGTSLLTITNAKAGKATLHMSHFVPVRMTDPDGLPAAVSFADGTGRCPGLVSFVQLDLAKVGTYALTLGPTPVDDLHIVYERTWVIAP